MNQQITVQRVVNTLEVFKNEFLHDIEECIESKISQLSIINILKFDYFTFVSRRNDGDIIDIYRPTVDREYIECLLQFVRGKKFKGKDLDSIITDDIAEIIIQKFKELYKQKYDLLSQKMIGSSFQNQIFKENLSSQIVETMPDELPEVLKLKAAQSLISKLEISFNLLFSNTIKHSQPDSLSEANIVNSPITTKIAILLIQFINTKLKIAFAKILSLFNLKKTAICIINEQVKICVFYTIIQLFLTTMILAICMYNSEWKYIVTMVIYMLVQPLILFENFKKKVSSKIKKELSSQYSSINKTIGENILASLGTISGGANINTCLQTSPDLQKDINLLWEEILAEIS